MNVADPLDPLDPNGALIAVIELSLSSWLVAGIVRVIERQPLKKLAVDDSAFHWSGLRRSINNQRRITADTALRLSLYFGNSPEFWMNLQTYYDLKMARQNLEAKDIRRIKAQWAT